MRRRAFLKSIGWGASALPLCAGCGLFSRSRKPNIILILVDDLGVRDTGFSGSDYYETPNIDRLAGRGVAFTRAYANAPNCAPSRACLLTGQYAPRHGVYTVGNPARGKAALRKLIPVPNRTTLDPAITTFPELLKRTGYTNGFFGKWHLGEDPESGPLSRGFSINTGGGRMGHPASYFSPYRNPYLPDGPEGEYLTDRLNREAVRFIRENRETPFFLFLSHYGVHTPLRAPAQLVGKYRKKEPRGGHGNPVYAAMIQAVDQGVGEIMKVLKELHLIENTIIVFFSDNGGVQGITSNTPLRGGKGMLYEGGIRVPLIMSWAGTFPGGARIEDPVMGTDLFPTFLDAAGISPPDDHMVDGVSLLPLLKEGKALPRRDLFWHFPAYLEGRAEGARDPHFRTRPAAAVLSGEWKLIRFFEEGDEELYRADRELLEYENRAGAAPDRRRQLSGALDEWLARTRAPVPDKPNPRYRPDPGAGRK